MFQKALTDRSSCECRLDVSPMAITRLVVETGGTIVGGEAHEGRVGATVWSRSCTSWRALVRLVPDLNRRITEESCGTDSDRTVLTLGTPVRPFSSGTVTSCSTSAAERPSASVWICTWVGANSGKTSSFCFWTCSVPKKISAAASPTTTYRNRRLLPTIQRISQARRYSGVWMPVSAPCSSSPPTVTTAVPGDGPDERNASVLVRWSTLTERRTKTSGLVRTYVKVLPSAV